MTSRCNCEVIGWTCWPCWLTRSTCLLLDGMSLPFITAIGSQLCMENIWKFFWFWFWNMLLSLLKDIMRLRYCHPHWFCANRYMYVCHLPEGIAMKRILDSRLVINCFDWPVLPRCGALSCDLEVWWPMNCESLHTLQRLVLYHNLKLGTCLVQCPCLCGWSIDST